MVRFSIPVAMIVIATLSVPAAAQIQEQCMDCYEKDTKTPLPDNKIRHDFQASCADTFPSEGGYELKNEDVGFGCSTAEVPPGWGEALNEYGRVCNSSDADLGCPEGPPPQPPSPEIPEDPPTCPNPPCNSSPIILDLGDESYRLTSLAGGVQFDLRNEGRRRQISWTRLGVENAFLARDRNGNGQIDNGSELFGNFTPLQSGALAPHGFIALAELDENHDGVVDRRDGAWSTLLLWTDRNHDGWTTPDELQGIGSSVVTALETDYRTIGKRDQWGNLFRYASKFRLREGNKERERKYYDVFFRSEP